MSREQQILPILYELALVIGGETSVKPLLMKTLQRLLYHTSFPAGLVFLDLPPDTGAAVIEGRLDAAVGDYVLGACIGHTMSLPATLLYGVVELREDAALLDALSIPGNPYAVFLRLPIDHHGVILLLASEAPHTELPLTRIFQPTMANLAKAILLCRNSEAYTNGILAERDVARETLRKVRQVELALRESENRLRAIMDSVQAGIVIIDPDTHKIVDVNSAAASMIGIAKGTLIGSVCHEFIYPPDSEKGACPTIDPDRQAVERSECVLLTASGERHPIIRSVTTVLLGGKTHLLASYIDITVLKQTEAQLNASLAEKEVLVQNLSELAIRDGLTGLYNHRAFYRFLKDELARAQRFDRPVSLLLLDIDHFKRVNDTYGHLAGDAVLRELGDLLGCEARAVDRVCRYGGEEIVVILPETDLETAANIAERLRAAVEARPFDANAILIRLTVSIGVASWPAHADNAQALIAAADAAMYAAKQGGRNRVVRYAPVSRDAHG